MNRQLFIAGDQQLLVETSRTFLNVRISTNDGEPVAVPAELLDAVATSLQLARAAFASDEAEYLRMRAAVHDMPGCAIFRGGRCTCDAQDEGQVLTHTELIHAMTHAAGGWTAHTALASIGRAVETAVLAKCSVSAGGRVARAPGSTDAERAAWLADKIVAAGDYAKEAAAMLRRWPDGVKVDAA